MDMQLGLTIEKLFVEVKLAEGNKKDLRAFGELLLYEEEQEEPTIKVRGFTIREKEFKGKKVMTVVFPAYPTSKRFQTSFILEKKSLWADVTKLFLDAYYQKVGGSPDEKMPWEEGLDVDEIDKGIEEMRKEQGS